MSERFKKHHSLCWDCKKATSGCSWSNELIPVEGWKAAQYKKKQDNEEEFRAYDVYDCPEFERDAYYGGQIRLKDYENKIRTRCNAT